MTERKSRTAGIGLLPIRTASPSASIRAEAALVGENLKMSVSEEIQIPQASVATRMIANPRRAAATVGDRASAPFGRGDGPASAIPYLLLVGSDCSFSAGPLSWAAACR